MIFSRGFVSGFVYAVAQCVRDGREDAAEFLWQESCLSEKDLIYCNEYDVAAIKDYWERSGLEL